MIIKKLVSEQQLPVDQGRVFSWYHLVSHVCTFGVSTRLLTAITGLPARFYGLTEAFFRELGSDFSLKRFYTRVYI